MLNKKSIKTVYTYIYNRIYFMYGRIAVYKSHYPIYKVGWKCAFSKWYHGYSEENVSHMFWNTVSKVLIRCSQITEAIFLQIKDQNDFLPIPKNVDDYLQYIWCESSMKNV